MNLYPEVIALKNTGDRFCDQRRGRSIFHGQDFQFTHNSLRKVPSGPNHVHSISRPDPVLPSTVQIDDIPLRHKVHDAHVSLELHNLSLHIAGGRQVNRCSLVSRKHELHYRITRRNSSVGPHDLNSGQILVNLTYLNHSEPID